MRELRELIAELEQRIGGFNDFRASLWTNVETALDEKMRAKTGR